MGAVIAAVRAGALGGAALVRAATDLAVYLYLPIYFHERLGESRMRVLALVPVALSTVRFLVTPWWGRQADRASRVGPLLAFGLAGYGLGVAVAARCDGIPGALAALCLGMAAAAAIGPAGKAATVRHTDSLAGLSGWFGAESIGYVLGSLWLSLTLGRWGWHPRRYLDSLALAACAVGLAALLLSPAGHRPGGLPPPAGRHRAGPPPGQRPAGPPPGRRPGGGVRARRPACAQAGTGSRDPVLATWVAASAVWEGVYAVYGLYLTRFLGVPTAAYGLLAGAATLVSAAAYPAAAWLTARVGGRRMLGWAMLAYAVAYGSMSSGVPAIVAAGNLIPCSTLLRMAVHRLVLADTARGARARALARLEAGEALAAAVGPPIGGWLADRWHPAAVPRLATLAALALWARARRLP